MNIAVDMCALPYTGMGVYADNLTATMRRLFPADRFIFYNDNLRVSRRSWQEQYVNTLARLYREQVALPRWLKKNSADVFFNPRNKGVPYYLACPTVVTIHDVLPFALPQQYFTSRLERYYYSAMIALAIRRSQCVITDSFFSRQELLKYTEMKPDNCEVIYLGYEPLFCQTKDALLWRRLQARLGITRPLIVAMGGSEYRKNIRPLLEIYRAKWSSAYDCVVVGGAWRGVDLQREFADVAGLRFVRDISTSELVCLYNYAVVFVFPSLYEGFGLPVLEAMACGAPVAAAKTSSIPEVAGDGALLFDPYDQADMYDKVELILRNESLRMELAQRALARAKAFSWEQTAKATRNVFSKVVR